MCVLQVVNQDPSGGAQEMELTEETKAYLAQLLQHSGAGSDTITHIQVGDQTLQIQRQEEEEDAEDIKFDPNGEVDGVSVAAVSSSAESVVTAEPTPEQNVVTPGALDGMVVTTSTGEMVNTAVGGEEAEVASLDGVQVVEMEDGQLGRIIHMDEGQMLEMAAGATSAVSSGQIFQMEGGQVIHLDHAQLMAMGGEDGQVVVSAADLVAAVQQQQQQHDIHQQHQAQHIEVLPSLTVTKRRGLDGQIVVEVEEDDKLMGLEQMVVDQDGAQLEGESELKHEIEENHGLQIVTSGEDHEGPMVTGQSLETTNEQILQAVVKTVQAGEGKETVKFSEVVDENPSSASGAESSQLVQLIPETEQSQAVGGDHCEQVQNQEAEVSLQEGYVASDNNTTGDEDIEAI